MIRAERIIGATLAVQEHLVAEKLRWPKKRRSWRCTDVLALIEGVRGRKDREWWYVAVIKPYQREWALLRVWCDRGRWVINDCGNALSWNDAIVEAMAIATRLR
jgi:hypothetical protein